MNAKAGIENHSRNGRMESAASAEVVRTLGENAGEGGQKHARPPAGCGALTIARVLAMIVIVTVSLIMSATAYAQQACVNSGAACQPDTPGDCGGDESCCSYESDCCNPAQEDCSEFPQIEICCPCNGPDVWPADDSTAILALTETTAADYRGTHPRGLYYGAGTQTNTIPSGHKDKGIELGGGIVPRATDGTPDWSGGVIGVLGMGPSLVKQEFGEFINEFIAQSSPDARINDKLVFVNGGRNTPTPLCLWQETPSSDPTNIWQKLIDDDLSDGVLVGDDSGNPTAVTVNQVQVVWIKMIIGQSQAYCDSVGQYCNPNNPDLCAPDLCGDGNDDTTPIDETGCNFPNWVYGEDGEVAKYEVVLEHLRTVFPNLRQCYLSSRAYGGRSNDAGTLCSDANAEPWAFENGFTVQELMRKQIFTAVPVLLGYGPLDDFPWIAWGPYFWANGTKANAVTLSYESEALTWPCFRTCADGVHPSREEDVDPGEVSGQSKVADLLFDFWLDHEVSKEWFHQAPAIAGSVPPNGTIDRLEDFDGETGLVEQGTDEVVITFTEEVFDLQGNAVDETDFTVTSTCQDLHLPCPNNDLPSVDSIVHTTGTAVYTVRLTKQIVPGHWTTIIANVEDSDGFAIRRDPHDRIDLGFLPADADASGKSELPDNGHLQCIVDKTCSPEIPEQHDQNRDGDVDTDDVTRNAQLLNGTNTTQPWVNVTLPARP